MLFTKQFFSPLYFSLIFIFTLVVQKLGFFFIIFSYITSYFDIKLESLQQRNFAAAAADAD
jgi:hypothetical protein